MIRLATERSASATCAIPGTRSGPPDAIRNFVKYARRWKNVGPRSHRIIAGNVVALLESGSTRRWKCLWNSTAPALSGAAPVKPTPEMGPVKLLLKEPDHQA